jgi:hypothetical protein
MYSHRLASTVQILLLISLRFGHGDLLSRNFPEQPTNFGAVNYQHCPSNKPVALTDTREPVVRL